MLTYIVTAVSCFLTVVSSNAYVQCSFESLKGCTPTLEKEIVVIVPSYNNKEWYERNLKSIFEQNYTNYKVVYVDDMSTDGTADLAQQYAEKNQQTHRFTLIRNTVRTGGLGNIYKANSLQGDYTICVELDGDDWFARPDVLSLLNKIYQNPDVWLTHGSFENYPSGERGGAQALTARSLSSGTYRGTPCEHPLRSWYSWLMKRINLADLTTDGSAQITRCYPTSWDHAFMLPMQEMAHGRCAFITDTVYVYNRANQLNDDKVRREHQMRTASIIHRKPAYSPLTDRPLRKKALISGIAGQDGSYLAEFLLAKGYEVHGIKRRSSSFNTQRLDHLIDDPALGNKQFFLHYGDVTDPILVTRLLQEIQPDEVYNLAAQSHVQVSFELPEYTGRVDALGTLNFLEGIRLLGLGQKTKFYQASTSELYGKIQAPIQDETTPFYPRSPYAVAKLYAYWAVVNYREAYGMFACNGILFNHESERRGETFVTRKITRGLASIALGLQDTLVLGNLDAKRDWGYAKDYVEAMWLMLQQETPQDFVIATGENHTVREFIEMAAEELGMIIQWEGSGVDERGIDSVTGRTIIEVSPRYFRPTEVEVLLGNPAKAQAELGWYPRTTFKELVALMLHSDLALIAREHHIELASRMITPK